MILLLRVGLTAVLLLAGVTAYGQYRALRTYQRAPGVEGARSALQLDPSNPDYHFNLGLLHRDRIEHWDVAASRGYLETATRLNPYNWRYWLELARTYEILGLLEKAERAYLKTLELNSNAALYQWRMANFYLRSGDLDRALGFLKRTAELDPSYGEAVFALLLRLNASPDLAVGFWPSDGEARLRILRFMIARGELAPDLSAMVDRFWEDLREGEPRLSVRDGDFYVRHLFERGRLEEARSAWIRLLERNEVSCEDFAAGENRVWNGSFENSIAGGTFGWHVTHSEHFQWRRLRWPHTESSHGLEFRFPGTANPDIRVVSQRVILSPGRRYRLSFRAQSQGVATEQGLFFEVIGSRGERLLRTDALRGDTPWVDLEGEFTFPPEMSWGWVRLRRLPSRRIDGALRGTFRVDSVAVQPLDR